MAPFQAKKTSRRSRRRFWSITWPHLIRLAWPAYTNEVVFLFQATALVYFTLPVIADQRELLAGVLTGGGAMQEKIPNHGVKNGMFSILIDPARFGDTGWMRQEMETLIEWVKSAPPRPGVEEVMIAGEPERKSRARRLVEGIPIDDNSWKGLVEAAQSVRVPAAQIPV